MAKYCTSCGSQIEETTKFCPNCGSPQKGDVYVNYGNNSNTEAKSRIVAGLLAIFLGGWGIHNFYLGYTNKGIMQLVITILSCGIGAIWGFIEGILIFMGNINTDANGIPLKD